MRHMKLYDVLTKPPLLHRILWWAIRVVLWAWAISSLVLEGFGTTFVQTLFCIAFSHLWDMFQFFGYFAPIGKVKYQAQTALNFFILFAAVLGQFAGLYDFIGPYDLVMHVVSGILVGWFAYDLTFVFQRDSRPPDVLMSVAFALMTGAGVATLWEIYEFLIDTFGGTNMQCSSLFSNSGLMDTMTDVICGVCGTIVGTFATMFQRIGLIGRNRKARRAAHKAIYAKGAPNPPDRIIED